jgi:hypothetical protein
MMWPLTCCHDGSHNDQYKNRTKFPTKAQLVFTQVRAGLYLKTALDPLKLNLKARNHTRPCHCPFSKQLRYSYVNRRIAHSYQGYHLCYSRTSRSFSLSFVLQSWRPLLSVDRRVRRPPLPVDRRPLLPRRLLRICRVAGWDTRLRMSLLSVNTVFSF